MSTPDKHPEGCPQRVQVEVPEEENADEIKILLQRHDENLGWYTANSMTLPRYQIPLLQQAIDRMNAQSPSRSDKVIPFPTLPS